MIDKITMLTEELLFEDVFEDELEDDAGWRAAIIEDLAEEVETARQDIECGRRVRQASAAGGATRRGKISSTTAAILELKRARPHLTSGQIAQKLGVRPSTVRNALRRAKIAVSHPDM